MEMEASTERPKNVLSYAITIYFETMSFVLMVSSMRMRIE